MNLIIDRIMLSLSAMVKHGPPNDSYGYCAYCKAHDGSLIAPRDVSKHTEACPWAKVIRVLAEVSKEIKEREKWNH